MDSFNFDDIHNDDSDDECLHLATELKTNDESNHQTTCNLDESNEMIDELKEVPVEKKKLDLGIRAKITLDKYRGVIWGCAIADAIGLQFEGCDYRRAKMLSDRGIKFPTATEGMIRGVIKGDWTDDTDHMVLLLDSAYFDEENIMRVDNKLFASKLVSWRYNGFPELGDSSGMGLGSLTAKLTSHHKYTLEPQIVALEVYKSLGGDPNSGKIDAPAPNGALMRIAPLALSEDYLDEVVEHCIVTHYDGRCVFSCVMQCDIIRHIIKHHTIDEKNIQHFYDAAIDILDQNFKNEVKEYYDLGMKSSIIERTDKQGLIETNLFEALEVGQYGNRRDKNGYTLVAFAIMLWGLRAAIAQHPFSSIIKTIISAGGDADTNAAITGAVIGAYVGYSCLPQDWINGTPHKAWLDKKIDNFLNRTK
jgi:ADP-ribosylglycohydrolase